MSDKKEFDPEDDIDPTAAPQEQVRELLTHLRYTIEVQSEWMEEQADRLDEMEHRIATLEDESREHQDVAEEATGGDVSTAAAEADPRTASTRTLLRALTELRRTMETRVTGRERWPISLIGGAGRTMEVIEMEMSESYPSTRTTAGTTETTESVDREGSHRSGNTFRNCVARSSFFFFCVCGGRTTDRPRETPPEDGKTARYDGVRPDHCSNRHRHRYRTTTTVTSPIERERRDDLSIGEPSLSEVLSS